MNNKGNASFLAIAITIITIILIFSVIVYSIIDEKDCYYECIDYTGENIICEIIQTYKTEMRGRKKDGTWIKINSYKIMRKGEN